MQHTPVINRLDRVRILESFADASHPRMEKISCSLVNGCIPAHIGRLLQRMSHARPICPTRIPSDMVTMNSVVRLVNPDTLEFQRVALVYDAQCAHDIPMGVEPIEIHSELGSELLARRTGETIAYAERNRIIRLRIDTIEYQPEQSGEYDR
jgi:regulator of nucleoside diphosphate kinase